jgi:glycosyltransferase involved in cell wall biosynthesis
MRRRRILVLSFFPAFNPPGSGGELRLLEIWRAVAQTHDVILITSTHMHDEASEVHHAPGFVEFRLPKEEHAGAIWDELQGLMPGAEVSALGVALGGGRFAALHQAYLDHYGMADIVVHTSPFTIDYDLFLGLDGKPRVYESYNAEHRLAPAIYLGSQAQAIEAYVAALERRLIMASDLVTVCSDEDKAAFAELVPDMTARMVNVPNGVTPAVKARAFSSTPRRVIFIGSAHRPNKLAANFIVSEIAPLLPDFVFDIVGGCLDETTRLPENVVQHGVITHDEKSALIQSADIALNPVVDGSGSNLKVAEYLSHGIPLLSTAFGVRGFEMKPHVHYLSSPLDRFAGVLKGAAENWERFQSIGKAGRDHIEQGFSWSAIGGKFSAELSALEAEDSGPFRDGIMLVLNDYPVSSSTGGGSTRIRGLYSAVAQKMPVVFLTFWEGSGVRTTRFDANMLEISVPKTDAHRDEQRRSDAKHHASSADVISLIHAPRNPMLVALYDHLRRFAWRIAVEHIYMVGLPQKFEDRFFHSSHNHELQLKSGILAGHPDAAALLRIVANAESHAVEAASLLIGVSEGDLTALSRNRLSFPPSVIIPNGVMPPAPSQHHRESLTARIGHNPSVFLGSGHLPNVEAARFLAGEVAPAHKENTFHFIGTVCESLHDLRSPNVVLWGLADEETKSRVLRSCELALNPVSSGGGSNVKFADYLAHGLPVLTTSFGLRGIEGADDHVLVTTLEGFSGAIADFFSGRRRVVSNAAQRIAYFDSALSLLQGSRRLLSALEDLSGRRKRVLFAAYRYGAPPQGGAEAHMLRFIEALSRDGRFEIDVIAPDVERIGSASRFRSIYQKSPVAALPVNLARVSVAKFEVDDRAAAAASPSTEAIWAVEPAFERAWMEPLVPRIERSCLLWGWSSPETHGDETVVRALQESAVFLPANHQVALAVRANQAGIAQVEIECAGQTRFLQISGEETIPLPAAGGIVLLRSSAEPLTPADPRRSSFMLTSFRNQGEAIPLTRAKLGIEEVLDGPAVAQALAAAAIATRFPAGVELGSARGPQSGDYYDWLRRHVGAYDLVIAHNAVFRPTIEAVREAKRARVPLLLVAQVHLDDDFYHFPDVTEAVRDASLTFVAPSEALTFFQAQGMENVRLLGAGVDIDEVYSEADRANFRAVYPDDAPFVLLLGRKSHSKNYAAVLDAAESMSGQRDIRVVMIGIDEDGESVERSFASYLGEQPRSVVRGALMCCTALVNMSRSESFGMVILEAWAAGAPVIANSASSAFRDLVRNGENGLLVTTERLPEAIGKLLDNPNLIQKISTGGRQSLLSHSWRAVGSTFVEACHSLIETQHSVNDGDEMGVSIGVNR